MYALTETIEQLLGPLPRSTSVNAMVSCPLHEDSTPSLSIHQEEGLWKCHSCGESGGIEKLARIVGADLGQEFYWDRAIAQAKEVPPVETTFTDLANSLYQNGLNGAGDRIIRSYLIERNTPVDARHHFWLGWDGYRISFPYWVDGSRRRGTCVAVRYRDQQGNKTYEAGSKRALYNVEEVRGAGRVLVCEGETDTILSWTRVKPDWKVCGVPGAGVGARFWELVGLDLLWATDIAIAFDADEAGDAGAQKGLDILGEKAYRVRPDEGLDLEEHFRKHGELPRYERN